MSTYYAIVSDDNTGPAVGVGTTKEEAWADAAEWAGPGRDGYKAVEITAASFAAIKGGNPDAVVRVADTNE